MDVNDLTSLLWLLVIGGLFFWMMKRGGCGMHAGHSHGSGRDRENADHGGTHGEPGQKSVAKPERDPVCGMELEPARAAGTRTVKGRTFYLCSTDCLAKFDRDPEGYARLPEPDRGSRESQPRGGHGHAAG